MNEHKDFERIRYETPVEGVARITLARPEMHNMQDLTMLYEIDAGYRRAVQDTSIKVIVLAADGPDFSLGHDALSETWYDHGSPDQDKFDPVTEHAGGYDEPGHAGHFAIEQEIYLGLCWRWRNLPKITVAQVHGHCLNGGNMLAWPCDFIIAGESAKFGQNVVDYGICSDEFFVHVWELGHRKAKEFLMGGRMFSAGEMHRLGSVNHVVDDSELESFTLDFARRLALRPMMGLKTAKMAVNQSLDAQGMWSALQSAYSLHHLGHANARLTSDGAIVDLAAYKKILAEDGPNEFDHAYAQIFGSSAMAPESEDGNENG